MLIQQKIETIHLSSSQESVAKYLLKKKGLIENMTIQDIASETYTSSTTIIRLAKKLGYDGFEVFKKDFLDEIKYLESHFTSVDANYPFTNTDSIQIIAGKMTELAKESLDDTLSLVEHDSLQKAIRILKKANIIHLSAISYPLLLGQLFQLNMSRLGKIVNINSLSGEELFLSSMIKKDDCLIMISYSGQINKMIELAKIAKNKNIPIIVITGLGDNELCKYASTILHIATREKLYSKIGGFTNENSIKLILDILYACYFANDYNYHLETKISNSKLGEIGRTASLDIMKED